MKQKIGICCPVHNEEENIKNFYNTYSNTLIEYENKYDIEFLFTDNCSDDHSFKILKDLVKENKNVSIIRYSKNFGVMKSIYTGIINAPDDWDALAVFDCDLQDPPSLINNFIQKWESGSKIVFGKRINREEPRIMSFMRKIYKKIYKLLQNEVQEIESGAWFLDKKIINELKRKNRFEPYLPGLINSLGFKSYSVPYNRNKRAKGVSKFNFFSYLSYAADGVVSGTMIPLRISIYFGIFVGILAIGLSFFFILAKFVFNISYAEGIAAMIVFTLFNFGINFFFLGIIGEYVGRVYNKKNIEDPAIIDEFISKE